MSSVSKSSAAPAKKVAKKESAPVATIAVAAPAPVAVAAPVKEAKAKSSKSAASSTAAASNSAAAVVAAPAPLTEAPAASAIATAAPTEPITTIAQDIESLTAQLQNARDIAVSGLKALGKLSKRVARDIKEAGRRRRRNRVVAEPGAAPAVKRPTIFTTPVTLKPELATFLGKPVGSQMTPADVTRAFSAYVDSHKLKDAEKGHTIHPDAAMVRVLGVKEGETLTYRNIQTYLYQLYDLPKKAAAAATVSA
jgi:chromatin remodeling complex protein RSC6